MNRTKIKELRQAHGYTMQDLSKLVGRIRSHHFALGKRTDTEYAEP